VKPRVVIFHISHQREIETQLRPCLRDESATTCLWFTTVDRGTVVSVYRGGSRLYFSEGRALVLSGDRTSSSVGGFEVLSSINLSINGQHSGPDHRHCDAQASQHNRGQRIAQRQEKYPDFDKGNRNSGYWRPQAQKQKYARYGRDQMGKIGCQSSALKKVRGAEIKQNRARHDTLQQKTSSRPAFGECGKQTLQTRPPIAGLMLVILERHRKGKK